MAEPSRKKKKGHGVPSLSPGANPELPIDPLHFITTHPKKPCVVDLRPFVNGVSATVNTRLKRESFTGRPQLLHELLPAIVQLTWHAPKHTVEWHLKALRAYWRLFDKDESAHPVRCLRDVNEFVGLLQLKERIRGSNTSAFLKIVNLAREKIALPPLYWPRRDDNPRSVDVPPRRDIMLVYADLKHRVISARKRYEEADSLAKSGRDLTVKGVSKSTHMSMADCHATYRALLSREKKLLLTWTEIESLSIYNQTLLRSIREVVAGIYPTIQDVQASFLLFVLKSGWNPQTALEIDIEGNYVNNHPTADGYHVVRAIKNRGGTIQEATGQDKSELSPKRLLEHLIERTRPLRSFLQQKLEKLRAQQAESPGDDELRLEISSLAAKVRSPWLYAIPRGASNMVDALNFESVGRSLDVNEGSTVMKSLVAMLNKRLKEANERAKAAGRKVEPFQSILPLTITDFRDAYAHYAYETSGYNWLMVKLALGHRNDESAKSYLRKRHFKMEGEAKIVKLTTAIINDIKTYRIVEPAFLFAQVEREPLTEQQRKRYFEQTGRTWVGTGCMDFHNPPPEIAPSHVSGKGCRVQRCTLCKYAILFPDSVDLLARRLAELNHLQRQLSVVTWHESSFGEEKISTESILQLFEQQVVESRLMYWEKEIAEGRHRPMHVEGDYA